MAEFVITPEDLQTSARKYRKELLKMPVMALGAALQHMTLRTGIRFSETVGELTGDIELGPYSETRVAEDNSAIEGRTLYTYFGSAVQNFSPNKLYKTIYGDNITKGEALKRTDITRQMVALLSKKVGEKLYHNLWKAVRNDNGDKTSELFNGLDTITATELTAGKLSAELDNYMTIDAIDHTNAVDVLKTICQKANPFLTEGSQAKLFVPRHVLFDYCENYKNTTGATPYNKEYKQYYVEGFENVSIVAMANKQDSPFIHLTTKQNVLIGVNQTGEEEDIEVARFQAFVLQFIMTMFFGTQFETLSKERLFVAGIDGKTAV